jgi:hypothetical protein
VFLFLFGKCLISAAEDNKPTVSALGFDEAAALLIEKFAAEVIASTRDARVWRESP